MVPKCHVLTRSIGHHENVHADVIALDLAPGDRLLLCSDGVSSFLPDERWVASRLAGDDLCEAAEALVDEALDRGGHDNASAVVIRVVDGAGSTGMCAA